jgi:hypothetical protein
MAKFKYKWERDVWRAIGRRPMASAVHSVKGKRDAAALSPALRKIFLERDEARGWKEIARVVGMHPDSIRRIYNRNPSGLGLRQIIYKEVIKEVVEGKPTYRPGRRFVASPGSLVALRPALWSYAEGGEARRLKARQYAPQRGRGTGGAFVKRSASR